jgi:hypothetical protein
LLLAGYRLAKNPFHVLNSRKRVDLSLHALMREATTLYHHLFVR